MVRLRLSASAARDLRRIGAVGQREHGLDASERYLAGFERLFRLLRDQPYAGQELPEIQSGLRSLSHRPHRILYRIEGDLVVVDRILHAARDLEQAFREHQ